MSLQELPMMAFIDSIKVGFAIICRFKGRSRRSLFWFFYLFTFLTFIPTIIFFIIFSKEILIILEIKQNEDSKKSINIWPLIVLVALLLINIILFLPLIAIGIRRLHDIGKSGYYLLLILIPVAGLIALIIFLVKDSDQNANEYGISMKYTMMNNHPLLANSQLSSDFPPNYQNIQNQQNYENQDIFENQNQEYPTEQNIKQHYQNWN